MKKILQIVFGLVLFLLPIYAWIMNSWGVGDAAMVLLKGGLVWGFIMIGVVLIVLGFNDLKA